MGYSKNAIISIMAFLLVFSTTAIAQNEEVDPGITPDQPFLYGLDKAWDRIGYALSRNKEAAGLKIARERIAEAKQMRQENKTEKAKQAEQEANRWHERIRKRAQEKNRNVPDIEDIRKDVKLPEQARKGKGQG